MIRKSTNFCAHFLADFSFSLGEIGCDAMTFWSVQAEYFFRIIDIQRREFSFSDFEENIFKISLHLDTYELLSHKLGMMTDMT